MSSQSLQKLESLLDDQAWTVLPVRLFWMPAEDGVIVVSRVPTLRNCTSDSGSNTGITSCGLMEATSLSVPCCCSCT